MLSFEWEINLTVTRSAKQQAKGNIDTKELDEFLGRLTKWADEEGFSVGGTIKAKRNNCPNCGRIVRRPTAIRCPMCGESLR